MGFLLVFLILVALLVSLLLGFTPVLIPVVYFMVGLLTFIIYAKDKRAAINGDWRVSEGTLHILSLLCGWPGAIIAQHKLRHKTRKASFRAVFRFTVLANLVGLAWLHTDQGGEQLRLLTSHIEAFIYNEIANRNLRFGLLYLIQPHVYL